MRGKGFEPLYILIKSFTGFCVRGGDDPQLIDPLYPILLTHLFNEVSFWMILIKIEPAWVQEP